MVQWWEGYALAGICIADIGILIILILGLLYIISVPGALCYFQFGSFKKFYHDIMGWHRPDDNDKITFDGLSYHCTCKFCHKEILQDSQGNWFTNEWRVNNDHKA